MQHVECGSPITARRCESICPNVESDLDADSGECLENGPRAIRDGGETRRRSRSFSPVDSILCRVQRSPRKDCSVDPSILSSPHHRASLKTDAPIRSRRHNRPPVVMCSYPILFLLGCVAQHQFCRMPREIRLAGGFGRAGCTPKRPLTCR